jgi:heme/copper-type cytochrome/quinol oxidase subunit 1
MNFVRLPDKPDGMELRRFASDSPTRRIWPRLLICHPKHIHNGRAWGYRMLTAKLFAGLAILLVVFAFASARRHLDLYFHATYIVLFFSHLLFFIALFSAGFALIYFAAVHWSSHPLSNSLGITHFVFMAVAFFLISFAIVELGGITLRESGVYLATARMEGEQAPLLSPLIALNIGALSFLAGCAIFVVNVGWTAIRAFRQS